MKHTSRGSAAPLLLLLAGLGLAPNPAQALSEIPFFVTNPGGDQCIIIDGPWSRTSGPVRLTPRSADVLVYSAEINLFSPYGEWKVSRAIDCDPAKRNQTETFCVGESAREIQLRLDSGLLVIDPPYRCGAVGGYAPSAVAATTARGGVSVVAAAHLGHEPAPGEGPGKAGSGSDHFRFEAQAGDTVEVALERDGARGSTGEHARLSLRREGGATLGRRKGAVPSEPGAAPLALTAKLPAAGNYVIEVAEVADGPGRKAFRGHYRLRVTSASGKAVPLEPLRSVEP